MILDSRVYLWSLRSRPLPAFSLSSLQGRFGVQCPRAQRRPNIAWPLLSARLKCDWKGPQFGSSRSWGHKIWPQKWLRPPIKQFSTGPTVSIISENLRNLSTRYVYDICKYPKKSYECQCFSILISARNVKIWKLQIKLVAKPEREEKYCHMGLNGNAI